MLPASLSKQDAAQAFTVSAVTTVNVLPKASRPIAASSPAPFTVSSTLFKCADVKTERPQPWPTHPGLNP